MQEPDQRDPNPISAQPPLPALDLRPLSTGELLDRVFFLYRARILLFVLVALVPALLGLVGGALQYLLAPTARSSGLPAAVIGLQYSIALLITNVLILIGYALSQAATTRLVSQLYLGGRGEPGAALKAAWPHTLRYVGIELWKVWSAMWVPFLLGIVDAMLLASRQNTAGGVVFVLALGGLVYGVIAYLRNSLAVPASVIEELGVRDAMRRSKDLVAGRKWRIFLLYLLLALLYGVALAVQSPLLLLIAHAKAPAQHAVAVGLELALSFVISALLSPVASIALCLFYFDERVRREGFDIDFLLRGPEAALNAMPATGPPATGVPGTAAGAGEN